MFTKAASGLSSKNTSSGSTLSDGTAQRLILPSECRTQGRGVSAGRGSWSRDGVHAGRSVLDFYAHSHIPFYLFYLFCLFLFLFTHNVASFWKMFKEINQWHGLVSWWMSSTDPTHQVSIGQVRGAETCAHTQKQKENETPSLPCRSSHSEAC